MIASRSRKRGESRTEERWSSYQGPATLGSKLSGLPSPRSFKPSVLTIWEVVSRMAEVKCMVSRHCHSTASLCPASPGDREVLCDEVLETLFWGPLESTQAGGDALEGRPEKVAGWVGCGVSC